MMRDLPRSARPADGGGCAISLSIVSHGQGALVASLLDDLDRHLCAPERVEVLLTLNVPEEKVALGNNYRFDLRVIENPSPKGFGANHNAAFALAQGEYFGVLNPDLSLGEDPLEHLLQVFRSPEIAVVAPLVVSPQGAIQDSARKFPTPLSIAKKLFHSDIRLDYPIDERPFSPDWTAGIFMLFRADAFERVGGFDERYHLYYEDVDICARLREAGLDVVLDPGARVTHHAGRRSHRDIRYLRWHIVSMLRFFFSYPIGGPRRAGAAPNHHPRR
jgi:N-acetylglucosaminyl-diphospho-decaprenol L-rhamnosyltransferase